MFVCNAIRQDSKLALDVWYKSCRLSYVVERGLFWLRFFVVFSPNVFKVLEQQEKKEHWFAALFVFYSFCFHCLLLLLKDELLGRETSE